MYDFCDSCSRSTIKIVLTYSQAGLPIFFEPGDHLSIFPENSPSLVSQLLERLDLSDIGPDDPIQLEYNKGSGSGGKSLLITTIEYHV